jgi:hypothetical protein
VAADPGALGCAAPPCAGWVCSVAALWATEGGSAGASEAAGVGTAGAAAVCGDGPAGGAAVGAIAAAGARV